MGKHAKRAKKRKKVTNHREVEDLLKQNGNSWRQAGGSHRICPETGMVWYEGEFSNGVANKLTKILVALGVLVALLSCGGLYLCTEALK